MDSSPFRLPPSNSLEFLDNLKYIEMTSYRKGLSRNLILPEVGDAVKKYQFLASILLLTLFPAARAQVRNPGLRPPDGGTREVLVSILIPSLHNAPFSATVSTESIRQLADGTTIRLKNRRAIARDGAGRIFQERRLLVPDDGRHEHESIVTQIEISDPVSHALYICVPRERVCQVESFSAPAFSPPALGEGAGSSPGSKLERLGKQTIGGLETVGIRESSVIEPGVIGNDNPIETRREYWYSSQLGLNLISKVQDPRIGIQNFEVTDIALSEPDPALFKISGKMELIDLRKTKQNSVPTTDSPR